MADVGTATFRAVADFSQVIRESKKAGDALAGLDAQAAGVGTTGKKGTSGFTKGFGNVADQATSTGKRMSVGLTAPLVAVGGLAVKTFASFESALVSAGARSGATAQQLARMKDVALEMGATTKFSAADAAGAMDNLASAGLNADETLHALPAVLLSAQASGSDLASTADIVAKAMNAFNIPAEKAGHISDVLAQAANTSAIDMEGLGLALGDAGQLGASANQSIEDVVAAISHLVNQGVPARSAGDAVRQAMDSMAAPTAKARELMDKLGIQVRDSRGEMLPWPKIMQNMQSALSDTNPEFRELAKKAGLSSGEFKDLALNTLFGVEGMKAVKLSIGETKPLVIDMAKETGKMSALAAGLEKTMGKKAADAFIKAHTQGGKFVAQGADAVVALAAMNRASDGTSKKFSDLFSETTAQTLDNLVGSIQTLAVTVVDALGPALDDNIKKVTDLVTKLGEFAKAHPQIAKMVVAFGLVLAAVGPLLIVFGKVISAVETIGGAVGKIAKVSKIALVGRGAEARAPGKARGGVLPVAGRAAKAVGRGVVTAGKAVGTGAVAGAKAVSPAVIASVRALGSAMLFVSRAALGVALAIGRAAGAALLATARFLAHAAAVAASTIAMGIARAATAAWTAVQWLLNAALSANPIGLVIAAIALLVAGIILAWQHSQTFRDIVIGGWNLIKLAVIGAIKVMLAQIGFLINAAAKAFGWIPGIGPKLKDAAAKFNAFRDNVNNALSGIKPKTIVINASVSPAARKILAENEYSLTREHANLRRATGGPIYGPGTSTSDSIPALLSTGEHVWAAREVRGAGGHAAVEMLRRMAASGALRALARGGAVGFAHGGPYKRENQLMVSGAHAAFSVSAAERARIAGSVPRGIMESIGSLPAQRAAVTRPGGQSQVTNYHLNNPQFTTPNPRRIYEQIRADAQFKSLAGGAEVA